MEYDISLRWFQAAAFGASIGVMVLAVPLEAGADEAEDRVSVQEYGAIGDGKADDTEALQAAINAGAGAVHLPHGVYRITEPLRLHLDETGPGAVIGDGTARIVMAGKGPALRVTGTHQGTANPRTVEPQVWERERMPRIAGIEIVGEHLEAVGIEAIGTMQLIISQVNIRNALHGIHLKERNRNVIITDCHLYENRGVGIYYDRVNLHQSNISGCHISYNGGGGIVVRGGDVRNIQIGTSDLEGNMDEEGPPTANVLLDATGGSIGEVAVVGCTIQHTHHAPESANIRIVAYSNERPFTDERRHGNFVVSDNVLSDARYNIDVDRTRALTVTGNTFWMGYDRDLRARRSANLVISNNVFDRNPRYHYGDGPGANHGLLFIDCDGVTVSGNHVRGTGDIEAAMVLRQCRRFNVTGCTVLDYRNAGLLLDQVTDSRVSDCLIRDDRPRNNGDGKSIPVRVQGGDGNVIDPDLTRDRAQP